MGPALLADALLVLHLAFIAWVVAGGFVAWWRPWLALAHLPAAAWGVWISWSGGVCPLTPLEQSLRRRAGQQGYEGGFVEHYLGALIYPAGLTPRHQLAIGGAVLLINAAAYAGLVYRLRSGRKETPTP
jgi:Protein of Unknown function (DUF2784)